MHVHVHVHLHAHVCVCIHLRARAACAAASLLAVRLDDGQPAARAGLLAQLCLAALPPQGLPLRARALLHRPLGPHQRACSLTALSLAAPQPTARTHATHRPHARTHATHRPHARPHATHRPHARPHATHRPHARPHASPHARRASRVPRVRLRASPRQDSVAALVDWASLLFFFGSCVSYLVIIGAAAGSKGPGSQRPTRLTPPLQKPTRCNCSGLPSAPGRGALAAWLLSRGCGGAPLPARSRRLDRHLWPSRRGLRPRHSYTYYGYTYYGYTYYGCTY